MTVNDSAQASDGFGVVSTPVPAEPAPIVPADPLRRKASGRVQFPGGVFVEAPSDGASRPIYLDHFGWMTRETAVQVAASLAGAVAEVQRQETRETNRKDNA
jgi:hypothetical protein